jgi:hypothetical protein
MYSNSSKSSPINHRLAEQTSSMAVHKKTDGQIEFFARMKNVIPGMPVKTFIPQSDQQFFVCGGFDMFLPDAGVETLKQIGVTLVRGGDTCILRMHTSTQPTLRHVVHLCERIINYYAVHQVSAPGDHTELRQLGDHCVDICGNKLPLTTHTMRNMVYTITFPPPPPPEVFYMKLDTSAVTVPHLSPQRGTYDCATCSLVSVARHLRYDTLPFTAPYLFTYGTLRCSGVDGGVSMTDAPRPGAEYTLEINQEERVWSDSGSDDEEQEQEPMEDYVDSPPAKREFEKEWWKH